MSEDEKDTLIQVLCPGNVVTSYSLNQGKSSTCNSGLPGSKKSTLVQQDEGPGDAELVWDNNNNNHKYNTCHNRYKNWVLNCIIDIKSGWIYRQFTSILFKFLP